MVPLDTLLVLIAAALSGMFGLVVFAGACRRAASDVSDADDAEDAGEVEMSDWTPRVPDRRRSADTSRVRPVHPLSARDERLGFGARCVVTRPRPWSLADNDAYIVERRERLRERQAHVHAHALRRFVLMVGLVVIVALAVARAFE